MFHLKLNIAKFTRWIDQKWQHFNEAEAQRLEHNEEWLSHLLVQRATLKAEIKALPADAHKQRAWLQAELEANIGTLAPEGFVGDLGYVKDALRRRQSRARSNNQQLVNSPA